MESLLLMGEKGLLNHCSAFIYTFSRLLSQNIPLPGKLFTWIALGIWYSWIALGVWYSWFMWLALGGLCLQTGLALVLYI